MALEFDSFESLEFPKQYRPRVKPCVGRPCFKTEIHENPEITNYCVNFNLYRMDCVFCGAYTRSRMVRYPDAVKEGYDPRRQILLSNDWREDWE